MKGIKMKKILKYTTIIGAAAMLTYSVATADTGGYVRIKNFDSHFNGLGFNEIGCRKGHSAGSLGGNTCRFASEIHDHAWSGGPSGSGTASDSIVSSASQAGAAVTGGGRFDNELKWNKDDGEGIIVGADFGFFRLEAEGTYQKGKATEWRGRTATGGHVYQARLFANIVVEPFDLIELLGEFGGIEPLVKYNPAHYGISPYAMYGYGVMGGLLENLAYTRTNTATGRTADPTESGGFAGGAMAAVNVGAGVNIGLDKLAKAFAENTGTTVPEYFKFPIEFSVGYHFQVGLDDLLFDSMNEDLGIEDGGLTYSVGLKW